MQGNVYELNEIQTEQGPVNGVQLLAPSGRPLKCL